MKFVADTEILKHYPSLHLGVIVLRDIDNSKRMSVISNLLQGAYAEKAREFSNKNLNDDPRIKVWQKAFKSFEMNPEKYKSSLEKLFKTAIKGKAMPSNNSLIDIGNYIALKYCVPIQCHDSDQLCGNLELTYGTGDEPYREEGSDKVKKVKEKEVIYKDEAGVVCRAWNHKKCDRTKCTSKTRNAVVLIDDMGVLGKKKLEAAMKDFTHLLEKYCGGQTEYYVLEHNKRDVDLGVEGIFGVSDGIEGEVKFFEKKSIGKGPKKAAKRGVIKKANGKTYAQRIGAIIQKALKAGFNEEINKIKIDYPKDSNHGDYACNIALQLAKKRGENPRDLAEAIIKTLKLPDWIEKVEMAGPGFMNFYLSKKLLASLIEDINEQGEKYGYSERRKGEKIMVEFAHPNTHKAFHIGHLRNLSLGESLVRILESQGIEIFRANYQGDVGPHVAKCLWGYMKTDVPDNLKTAKQKAEFLGKVYAKGSKAYEEDEKAKAEIQLINKQIYQEDDEIMPLWEETRKWSLDYFDEIYQQMGSHFDRLFFESEVWKLGHDTVMNGLEKGIFEKSDGAIIYNGEKHGLHKRVFVTKQDTATYEGKEMGLFQLESKAFDFDKKVHVVANEQSSYFQVVFKAIEELNPAMKEKQEHVDYGMVKLASGKMSSRTGDVITAESLLKEAADRVKVYVDKTELPAKEKEEVTEMVAIGAMKFMMLHATANNDIIFDIDKATRLEGASGPYLQYAHARIKSIIKKVEAKDETDYSLFNDCDWKLAKKMVIFPEIVSKAAIDLSTHHITHYLLDLASEFSSWYDKNHVAKAENELLKNSRVKLISAVASIIKNGLELLGMKAPERM